MLFIVQNANIYSGGFSGNYFYQHGLAKPALGLGLEWAITSIQNYVLYLFTHAIISTAVLLNRRCSYGMDG